MKTLTFSASIFLYSPMRAQLGRRDVYAPTQHPSFDGKTRDEAAGKARSYARKTLKLEENLTGKGAFTVRTTTVRS